MEIHQPGFPGNFVEESRSHDWLLQMLIEQAPLAIALLEGPELRHVQANSLYRAFADNQPVLGRTFTEVFDDRASLTELEQVYQTGKEHHVVDRLFRRSTGDLYLSYSLCPIFNTAGSTEAILIIAQDTTERVQARKGLEEEKARLKAVLELLNAVIDQMPAGVLIVDKAGIVIMANQKMAEIWGRPISISAKIEESIAGQAYDADGRPIRPSNRPLIRALRNGETVQSEEYELERQDGTRVSVMVSAAPVRDESGEIIAAVVVDEDITKWKILESELLQHTEDRARFLQTAAHELRNPMAALKGVCALMQRRIAVGKSIDELPGLLDREISRLSDMLTEVLEAFRIQRGEMQPQHVPTNLVDVVDAAVGSFLAGYEKERFIITGLDRPVWVQGDARRLEDVVRNLIGNAIKYSPADGRIYIALDTKNDYVLITLRDEGIGIPADQLTMIFAGFYRATNVYAAGSPSGLGLGLHICDHIVRRHGGRIWAESKEGRGATFFVELPLINAGHRNNVEAAYDD